MWVCVAKSNWADTKKIVPFVMKPLSKKKPDWHKMSSVFDSMHNPIFHPFIQRVKYVALQKYCKNEFFPEKCYDGKLFSEWKLIWKVYVQVIWSCIFMIFFNKWGIFFDNISWSLIAWTRWRNESNKESCKIKQSETPQIEFSWNWAP